MNLIEVKVPDMGDFKEVTVIELLVQVGDTIEANQSLITVESDKASMEIPASHGGLIKALHVKLGDKVNTGSLLLTLEGHSQASVSLSEKTSAQNAHVETASKPKASSADVDADLVVLGGGPGGYSAAFRAADLGLKVIIVERYSTLGGVCLNVGCIPSKALLHVAAVMQETSHLASLGISFGPARIDISALRQHKNTVINKLTEGLSAMAKMRQVKVVRGIGHFVDAHTLKVSPTTGAGQERSAEPEQEIRFRYAIVAAGSQPVALPFFPQDERIIDSTGALALNEVPSKMLIVGGGIIGLEMATVYSALGAQIDIVEMSDGLMQGADRDLVKVWQKMNAPRFGRLMTKTKTVAAKATKQGIEVTFENSQGESETLCYDKVLQAVGRTPNGHRIQADKAGIAVNERGFITVDAQMRTSVAHIFAIGDIVGQPMLAHKAVHEAHVAAEVIAGACLGDAHLQKAQFDASVIPSVAYTDPEVSWVGLTEEQAKAQGIAVKKGLFPWSASGRAIANTREEGFTKLLFEVLPDAPHGHGRILGGGIVGVHAGDMIGEIALAIEMGANAIDIGKTIHPHPTFGESIGMAAEVAHGTCTDLPPQKKRP